MEIAPFSKYAVVANNERIRISATNGIRTAILIFKQVETRTQIKSVCEFVENLLQKWPNHHLEFEKFITKTRKINRAVRIDYETLFNYIFLFNRRIAHFKLKLLKFTSKQYRSSTVTYRISLERPCSKSITATYAIFDREHAGVDLKDIYKIRRVKDILALF